MKSGDSLALCNKENKIDDIVILMNEKNWKCSAWLS